MKLYAKIFSQVVAVSHSMCYFKGLISGYKNKHRIFTIFRPIAFQWCIDCYDSDENQSC